MPLARDHPLCKTRCFWSASDGSRPIRYETQADILRLLNLVSRHYAAASLSIRNTRSFDAARIITFACIATVTDAVIRRIACDVPSQFSLHYSGLAEGPVRAFGFDMRHFALESETLQLTSPGLQACRTQVLDYFSTLRNEIIESDDETLLFRFERSMNFGKAERNLMTQLCVQIGFPEGEDGELLPYYLSGEEPTVLENYPELGYLRDIVFLFKIMMAPTKESLPGLKRWEPSQARLVWQFRGDSKEESEEEQKKNKKNKKKKNRFVVGAFGSKDLKCVAYVSEFDEDGSVGGSKNPKKSGIIRGAMNAITRFFWSRSSRSPPSQADPNVLLKGSKSVKTEEDVLHIRHLPDFEGRLGAQSVELLLQYLTAPYLRIPLVMRFFAVRFFFFYARCRSAKNITTFTHHTHTHTHTHLRLDSLNTHIHT
jgi:hypothetical protein